MPMDGFCQPLYATAVAHHGPREGFNGLEPLSMPSFPRNGVTVVVLVLHWTDREATLRPAVMRASGASGLSNPVDIVGLPG